MKAYAYNNLAAHSVDLTLYDRQGGTARFVMPCDMIVQSIPEDTFGTAVQPTYSWPFDIAEAIFQTLWDTGYRPAKGQAGAAEVEALKGHIAFAERVTDRLLPKAK